jgi:hypothetical protein
MMLAYLYSKPKQEKKLCFPKRIQTIDEFTGGKNLDLHLDNILVKNVSNQMLERKSIEGLKLKWF